MALNASASEWRPGGAVAAPSPKTAEEQMTASSAPASSSQGHTSTPPHQPAPHATTTSLEEGPPRYEVYPPPASSHGDAAGHTDDDDDDDDPDGNWAWANEQAALAEAARNRGQQLPHPEDGTPPLAPQRDQPRMLAPPPANLPPGVRVGAVDAAEGGGGGFNPNAPAFVPPGGGEGDDRSMAPSMMTTATSIMVGMSVPRATGKERRRNYAKEHAKEQRRKLVAEKSGLETFSAALLHSVSPFMAPLRQRTGSSLPHIKLDQRFGRRGQAQTAVMQFIVAPVVSYRPAHYQDLAPGDVLEYHYDLARVLKTISSAHCICINYGREWKPFTVPYSFLSCKNYKAEVQKLCPKEVPNARSDPVYEEDVVKDVTHIILAVPELAVFKTKSFVAAMQSRANLYPMYSVFVTCFQGIKNYQIQIRDLDSVPPRFLLKTSATVLAESPKPIAIQGSAELWQTAPNVSPSFSSGAPAPLPEAAAAATSAARPPSEPRTKSGKKDASRQTATTAGPAVQSVEPTVAPSSAPSDRWSDDPVTVGLCVAAAGVVAIAAFVALRQT